MPSEFDTLLGMTFKLANAAKKNGNMPFGALLANSDGEILLEAENTVCSNNDCTAHAELNLISDASRILSPEILQTSTLYASTEPCPMCAGALFWSGIPRLVYALGAERFFTYVDTPEFEFPHCRRILCNENKPIEVFGPLLEDEAIKVHHYYWTS